MSRKGLIIYIRKKIDYISNYNHNKSEYLFTLSHSSFIVQVHYFSKLRLI